MEIKYGEITVTMTRTEALTILDALGSHISRMKGLGKITIVPEMVEKHLCDALKREIDEWARGIDELKREF